MNSIKDKAIAFSMAIQNVYEQKLELEESDLTEDFTAMLLSLHALYKTIIDKDEDLVGFTHILNRLAVQYIMEESEE